MMSPHSKKFKKVGGGTTVHDERSKNREVSPSPFKKTVEMINATVNNLESRFTAALNLVGNPCGNLNTCSVDKQLRQNTSAAHPISNLDPYSIQQNHHHEIKLLRQKNEAMQTEMNILSSKMCNLEQKNQLLSEQVSNLKDRIDMFEKNEISCYQTSIHRGYLSSLLSFKVQILKLIKHVTSARYAGRTDLGRRLLGEVIATHPSISFVNAAEIIMISRAQLLTEPGIVDEKQLSYDDIGLSSPSEKYLRTLLDETATDVLFLLYYRIAYEDKVEGKIPSLFLSCDKATNGGFVKIISWYSPTTDKVEQYIFDVDRTYGESKECAKAM